VYSGITDGSCTSYTSLAIDEITTKWILVSCVKANGSTTTLNEDLGIQVYGSIRNASEGLIKHSFSAAKFTEEDVCTVKVEGYYASMTDTKTTVNITVTAKVNPISSCSIADAKKVYDNT
jgi:hypothetical protein